MAKFPTNLIVGVVFFVAVVGAPVSANENVEESRIAVISGIDAPHRGFAISTGVSSDATCLELAQSLVSEIGISVHVVCADPATGQSTIVAECGFTDDPAKNIVGSFHRNNWSGPRTSYLVCVRPTTDRYPAKRIQPKLTKLRPAKQ